MEAARSLLSVSQRRLQRVALLWRLVVQSGAKGPKPGLRNASYWHYTALIGPSAREEGPGQRYRERSTESLPVSFCAQNSNRINEGGSVPFLGEVTPSSQFPMTGSIVQSHSWDCPCGLVIKNSPANAGRAFQWQELKSLFSSWKWKKWKKGLFSQV